MIVTGYTNAGEAVKKILLDIGIEECIVDAAVPKPFVDVSFKTKADMHLYKVTDNKQYYTYKGRPTNIRCEME